MPAGAEIGDRSGRDGDELRIACVVCEDHHVVVLHEPDKGDARGDAALNFGQREAELKENDPIRVAEAVILHRDVRGSRLLVLQIDHVRFRPEEHHDLSVKGEGGRTEVFALADADRAVQPLVVVSPVEIRVGDAETLPVQVVDTVTAFAAGGGFGEEKTRLAPLVCPGNTVKVISPDSGKTSMGSPMYGSGGRGSASLKVTVSRKPTMPLLGV